MPRHIFFLVVLWLGLAVPVTVSATTETGATQLIQSLSDKALTILRQQNVSLDQRETELHDLLYQGFDVDLIGRVVLGRTWRKATPQQRSDYLQLFGDYIVDTFANRFGSYSGEAITVLGTRPTGKQDLLVDTQITRPSGPPVKASWRVRDVKGKHKVIDVVVEGISLVLTQRQEFASVIKSSGINGLIEILRAKTERLPAASS